MIIVTIDRQYRSYSEVKNKKKRISNDRLKKAFSFLVGVVSVDHLRFSTAYTVCCFRTAGDGRNHHHHHHHQQQQHQRWQLFSNGVREFGACQSSCSTQADLDDKAAVEQLLDQKQLNNPID
ncbi:hypothetical protein T11_1356 [Trichinella zimbabwensis]|uniref:Uncharacterized protein n=1 Tax=Trichinella zimbabwensis TaxID=268475 RepID=A0A0V1H636_9BILA|nr:hypothetical protein T11_1356 [Trichinella zimbabwensis]